MSRQRGRSICTLLSYIELARHGVDALVDEYAAYHADKQQNREGGVESFHVISSAQ